MDPNPDPDPLEMLDPDLDSMNPDPQHWEGCYFLLSKAATTWLDPVHIGILTLFKMLFFYLFKMLSSSFICLKIKMSIF